MSFSTYKSTSSSAVVDSSAHFQHQAAISIQKLWRGYSVRKALKMSHQAAQVIQQAWENYRSQNECFICHNLGNKADRLQLTCCPNKAHITSCLKPWFEVKQDNICPYCQKQVQPSIEAEEEEIDPLDLMTPREQFFLTCKLLFAITYFFSAPIFLGFLVHQFYKH